MDYNCGVDCSIFELCRHSSLESLEVFHLIHYTSILWLFSIVINASAAPNDSVSSDKNSVKEVETTSERQLIAPESDEDTGEEVEEEPTTEELLQQIDLTLFDLPIVINESVVYWVEHFSNSGRWTASRWIRASGKYRNLIQNELGKANLPKDLLYLAMIESGFNPTAESHAKAMGIWQFIPETGRLYGLQVDDVIDERKDPIRSTQAAIAYLSKLNKEFGGNWHLALAAYNAGEKRIYKSISKTGTINYWELRDDLAEETQFYVPKILALAILDKYPTLFGVPKTEKKEKPLVLKQVSAKRNQHVSTLADMAEMTVEEFIEYNPHLLKERILVEEKSVRIYVPPSKAEVYTKNSRLEGVDRLSSGRSLTEDELANLEVKKEADPDLSHHQKTFEHTVADGDNWVTIAKQYGLSKQDLQQWNPDNTLLPESVLRLTKPKTKKYVQHTVKSSDTLKALARKYDCSIDEIKQWNGMGSEDKIQKGDILWIRQ